MFIIAIMASFAFGRALSSHLTPGPAAFLIAMALLPTLIAALFALLSKMFTHMAVDKELIGGCALTCLAAMVAAPIGIVVGLGVLMGRLKYTKLAEVPVLGWIIKIIGGAMNVVSSLYSKLVLPIMASTKQLPQSPVAGSTQARLTMGAKVWSI